MRCIYRLLSVCVLHSGLRTPHATPLLFIFCCGYFFNVCCLKAWLQVTICRVPHTVFFFLNNRSALQHPEFVAEAISELLSNGWIVEHEVPPFCANPLTVAEGKKLRLVIDLRHVNNYLFKPKFKYEDLRSLSQVLDEGHWFFTWDLKSGYHHVDICLDHQKYLGFAWPFSGVVRYFSFTVLPLKVVLVFVSLS